MPISNGLKTSLNKMRELSSELYHQYIPIVDNNTDISVFGAPILNPENTQLRNEFISLLVNRIAYTKFEIKYFKNPLQILEGDEIPLGYIGEETYINPKKGRKYNGEDFVGLLQKYESDVKVQFTQINMDLQYPVTVNRNQLRGAFLSWENLQRFVEQITNSLYNGAYIDEFTFTKGLIPSAYKNNAVHVLRINNVSDVSDFTEAIAKQFVIQARTLFLNFQTPSTNYNGWKLVNTQENEAPITTWTNPEDIVFIVRNDLRSYIDVELLSRSMNMEKSELLGRILTVDNFDLYDEEGNKIFDGSKILGFIGDKNWFRIKRQDMFLDEWYNPNNRTYQFYLNLTKMYMYSLFANGVVIALPEEEHNLTNMTKAELLAYATELGVEGITSSSTKAQIREAIEEYLASQDDNSDDSSSDETDTEGT